MTESYSELNGRLGDLFSAYFTKAPDFVDPMDTSKGFTGKVPFTINEQFKNMESIQRHVENATQNDYFEKFGEILGTHEK